MYSGADSFRLTEQTYNSLEMSLKTTNLHILSIYKKYKILPSIHFGGRPPSSLPKHLEGKICTFLTHNLYVQSVGVSNKSHITLHGMKNIKNEQSVSISSDFSTCYTV
jgi:hypothetical protein